MDTTPAFDFGDSNRHLPLADALTAAAAAGHDLVEVERGWHDGHRADELSAHRVAADRQREGYPLTAQEQALVDSYRRGAGNRYTEDPPDDWTPPARPYQPPPPPVVQRISQPPRPRMTPRTRRRIPALRPEPQVLSQGRKLLYRLTCAYQDRPVTAAGLAAAADTPCHQSGGPVWWDEETQFWTGPLVWAAGLKDTAATEAELFSALIPRWRENGVTVRSQRTKGIASRHTLRSWKHQR